MAIKSVNTELIIGLVCAVGTETPRVIQLLEERLGLAGYQVETIKISKEIIPLLIPIEETNNSFERIDQAMKAGNACRALGDAESPPDDSVLAMAVAARISEIRSKLTPSAEDGDELLLEPLQKTAIVIDSFKRPEEIEFIRNIYPSGFVLIGVHADEARRREHLINNLGMKEEQANDLIDRDGEEIQIDHGQRVNSTFHRADFFVKISDNSDTLRCDIARLVELWFGNPFLTRPSMNTRCFSHLLQVYVLRTCLDKLVLS